MEWGSSCAMCLWGPSPPLSEWSWGQPSPWVSWATPLANSWCYGLSCCPWDAAQLEPLEKVWPPYLSWFYAVLVLYLWLCLQYPWYLLAFYSKYCLSYQSVFSKIWSFQVPFRATAAFFWWNSAPMAKQTPAWSPVHWFYLLNPESHSSAVR